MQFEILSRDGLARRGRLTFAHGSVETPVFMPVGTYGSVKAMSPADLLAVGAQIVLGNTFHLWLRPGLEVVAAHGGLHRFMAWDKPILSVYRRAEPDPVLADLAQLAQAEHLETAGIGENRFVPRHEAMQSAVRRDDLQPGP